MAGIEPLITMAASCASGAHGHRPVPVRVTPHLPYQPATIVKVVGFYQLAELRGSGSGEYFPKPFLATPMFRILRCFNIRRVAVRPHRTTFTKGSGYTAPTPGLSRSYNIVTTDPASGILPATANLIRRTAPLNVLNSYSALE